MKPDDLASLSLAELRDRLIARIEKGDNSDGLDLQEILRYYIALPAGSYTSDGADGLIQLARNFSFATQPADMLEAASLASRMAIAAGDRLLLCRARNKEGFALAQLGRSREAAISQAQSWSLARELQDKKLEMFAIWGFSTVCVAMGQWNLAIRYCERMRALAEEMDLPYYEFLARGNIADCALQVRDAALGLHVLSGSLQSPTPPWMDSRLLSFFHINLGRLYLLVGNLNAAKFHAEEGTRWAVAFSTPSVVQLAHAVQGLVNVRLGEVETGLAAVIGSLSFAKRANQTEVPSCLAMCIDACEDAGQLDRALNYLNELVDWKKRSIDGEVMALPFEGLTESAEFQTGSSLFDRGLIAKAHSLQSGVRSQIERLTEIALNAEIASGYDLYRPFRTSKLARFLAAALGWHQQRIDSLALAARLANIGMIAIPSRILLKRESLSGTERGIVRGHARYGGELLRKSKLQALEIACLVAEQHHERYDGSGYPLGLSGNAITEEARIVAICDVFDAMTHNRPWRAPLDIQTALNELERVAGVQFDSVLVRAFCQLIRSEFWQPSNLDTFLAEGADDLEYVRAHARMEAVFDEQRPH